VFHESSESLFIPMFGLGQSATQLLILLPEQVNGFHRALPERLRATSIMRQAAIVSRPPVFAKCEGEDSAH
jgi:hypothetical protein